MKKILNEPTHYVLEMLEGLCAAHPNYYRRIGEEGRVVVRPDAPVSGKVGIVTGGGSGHLPVFTGYLGPGLLDACAIGDVFSSPGVDLMADAIRAANSGAGVLRLYGNYGGDVMNFDMAGEIVEMEGIRTTTVLVADDVASAGPEERHKRRGVAGLVYCYKMAGAKAAAGGSLDEVTAIAQKAADACRSVGVALTPCTVPAAGRPTFQIGEDEMDIGMGVHGEPGIRRGPLRPADEVASDLVEAIAADIPGGVGGRELALLVNGLGATAHLDQYILYRAVRRRLEALGATVSRSYVGEYVTSLEMAGASVTVMLLEPELRDLLDAPVHTPRLRG
jgi:dihydroxyacetone kinase-like protein